MEKRTMPDIHPSAVVSPDAKLGAYVKIWSGAIIAPFVQIGDNCVIGAHAYVGYGTIMGESCRLQTGVFLPNYSCLGKRVFIGPNVTATDDRHPKVNNPSYKAEPPIFEDDCSVGAGAVILPGIHIGHHAMVGAGAVVTHDVEPYSTVVGCPAMPMKLKEAV
jgi:UDP-2-acetamido-3-amino-2,3-dideoxy-glucuronate N-acetyltransferase